jgi:hypothetical protein
MNKPLIKAHKEFCRQISLGLSQTEAYMVVYPNCNRSSANVAASTLMTRQDIREGVAFFQQQLKEIVFKAGQEVAVEGTIASAVERMQILTKIARGEMVVVQQAVFEGQAISYVTKPSFGDIKAAINELNKMDGSHKPIELDVTVVKEQPLFPAEEILNIDEHQKSAN